MSGLIGAAQSFGGNPTDEDRRLDRPDLRYDFVFADVWPIATATFASPWWPGGGLIGDLAVDVGVPSNWPWSPVDPASGAASRYGFVGVTRDVYGSAVGNCTVKLYRTSDDILIDSTISDVTTGAFLLNTPYYPATHYLVAHKTGSPDIDGVTPNTLIGV